LTRDPRGHHLKISKNDRLTLDNHLVVFGESRGRPLFRRAAPGSVWSRRTASRRSTDGLDCLRVSARQPMK